MHGSMAGFAPLTSLARRFAEFKAAPSGAAPPPPSTRPPRRAAPFDAAAALEAVDLAFDVAGLPADSAQAAFVVSEHPALLLEALFERCPDLGAVLLVAPAAALDELFRATARGAAGTIDFARCQVADPADLPAEAAPAEAARIYLTLCQFLRERGCAPASALLVCDDGIPPGPTAALGMATLADDLCLRFSARFFAEIFPTDAVGATFLRQQADVLFEARDFYHALKFYWPLYQTTRDPQPAWRILECWSELACPEWVDLWLNEPAFGADFRAQVRAELAADLADDRALCAARLERNRAALLACAPSAANLLQPAARAGFALVHVANVPWKIATAARGSLCLERGEYRLLVGTAGKTLVEANPPPTWGECEGVIGALRILGQPPIGVAGWVRNAWGTQLFLSLKNPDRIPGWVQQVFLIESDAEALAALLATVDLSQLFSPERVRLFVGPAAFGEFADFLRQNPDVPPVGIWAGLTRQLDSQLRTIESERMERAVALKRDLDRQHDDAALRRTADALQGRTPRPLRIFFTTSIYTDVLQYMVADLAAGFRALGHECLVLSESRPGEQLHPATIAARLLEFRADAMVLLDHTRSEASAYLPAKLPCITWIQDDLPALKDPAHIAKLGPLDLAYGLNTEVQADFRVRRYPFVGHLPFAVDPAGFPAGNATGARRAEVVFATNVAELPERTDAPALGAALERRLGALAQIPLTDAGLAPILRTACAEVGLSPTSPEQHRHLDYWAFSIARRLDRLRMADLLFRAGIPLALYGRGWDAIPRFAPLHRGVVAPNAIREVYAQHKVVLHINRGCNLHPRLLEGFLAGAFVLARHDPADDLPGETVDQFALGRELVLFRDEAELLAHATRALHDEDWRSGVVAAAQARIRRDHTFVERAKVLLGDLARIVPGVVS
jgi:hypothetical protein